MGELGNRLREAREKRGLSLAQAEEMTRIRRAFLEALEEERFEVLPGDVYARGFIRNYARFLGLDAEVLIADYRKTTGTSATYIPHVLDQPLMRHPVKNTRWAVLISVLACALLALAGWQVYERYELGSLVGSWLKSWQMPALTFPQGGATPEPTPVQPSPTKEMTPVQLTTVIAVAASSTPLTLPSPTPTATEQPTATATPTWTPSPSPTPTAIVGVRVEGKVSAPTYMEVTLDGQRVYAGILQPGDERVWSAQRTVFLVVGNAGGIKLTVNGVEIPSLGKDGEVVSVTYSVDNLPRR